MARIAMPVAADFEDSEFSVPYDRLRKAGHEVVIVGMQEGAEVRGKRGKSTAKIETTAERLREDEFDALVIAGGYSPDKLRLDPHVVDFVRRFTKSGRPVAAICHAASLLVEAGVVEHRTLTSWPSVRKDVENAGGIWVDSEVVEDENLITSRKPDDLEAFCNAIEARIS